MLYCIILLVVATAECSVEGDGRPAGIVRQLVERYLTSCRLAVVGAGRAVSDPSFTELVRVVGKAAPGVVVMEAEGALSPASPRTTPSIPQQALESDAKFPCRAFLLYMTAANTSWAGRFLGKASLDVSPEIRVIGVGHPALARQLLTLPVLRNTAHALYLAVPPRSPFAIDLGDDDAVEVISRCHYCDQGHPDYVVLDYWRPLVGFQEAADLFPNQFQDCRGHAFQVVSMDWFPFLSFSRDTQRPGTTVTPQDSVDVRMLQAVARTLNFT
ncbi:hypothetical protein E2C01_034109 [Portunus trituberculatus]|uniref:Secreted protein n=1 Tax=Portunus trituberculatus TaxID=210409 RepID=A0A5B7F603_PORTR|nr:hypothetical protein [Portunus trituberculatus]